MTKSVFCDKCKHLIIIKDITLHWPIMFGCEKRFPSRRISVEIYKAINCTSYKPCHPLINKLQASLCRSNLAEMQIKAVWPKDNDDEDFEEQNYFTD